MSSTIFNRKPAAARQPARADAETARPSASHGPLLAPELMARVRQIQIRTHRLVNTSLSGGYRSTFRGSGLEFSEVRAYQPGDDVRRIDWNVTARSGHPYIKTYAEERELTIQFVVDTSLSMDFGSRVRTKRETAAQFCALMSFVALRHQDRVGLTLFGARPGLHLPAKKKGSYVLRVVREVIAAPPEAGGSGFGPALETVSRVMRRRCVLFLVSDFLAQSAPVPGEKDWLERLRELSRRHDVIAVRVTDPFELELPAAGLVELVEGESGRVVEVDTRSKAVRDAWRERAAARRTEQTALLSRAGVDILDLDTSKDLGEPILSFFARRAKRHGGA
ncbi:MAG: DUF58 domain-containing protein [Planctomycetes bacterium]|nr:DUF58 domain-containing protein [Planctomycetota bacterium]